MSNMFKYLITLLVTSSSCFATITTNVDQINRMIHKETLFGKHYYKTESIKCNYFKSAGFKLVKSSFKNGFTFVIAIHENEDPNIYLINGETSTRQKCTSLKDFTFDMERGYIASFDKDDAGRSISILIYVDKESHVFLSQMVIYPEGYNNF